MKKGDIISVTEKQYGYRQDGKYRCKSTGLVIKVKVEQVLDDGVHVSQICDSDGKPMTMRYWNNEIL